MTKRDRMDVTPGFYVSTFIDSQYDMYMAIAKPSSRQIELLPILNAAIRGDKGIKRQSIVSLV